MVEEGKPISEYKLKKSGIMVKTTDMTTITLQKCPYHGKLAWW
jgi:hypothetical protein